MYRTTIITTIKAKQSRAEQSIHGSLSLPRSQEHSRLASLPRSQEQSKAKQSKAKQSKAKQSRADQLLLRRH